MKIGIQHIKSSFSEGWIKYCKKNAIDYKLVNCYASDIIQQMEDCGALMWHFHHAGPRDVKFAKQLLYSVQASGKKVFPDFNTVWHFDDKIGQKYLLEAVGAPLIPSYVFYSKHDAFKWARQTNFPKVFKLRGGAGSANVRMVKTQNEALKLINKAFYRGFSQYNAWESLKERWRKYSIGKTNANEVVKGFARLVYPPKFSRITGREKGYVYFQDFIPNNDFDIRIIVISDKAYGMRRLNRKGDFRASGSEEFSYESLDPVLINIAFNVSEKLNLQAAAFDFIYDNDLPLIVELSYAFGTKGSSKCPGYWDRNLNWYPGTFDPYGWMVDLVLVDMFKKT